MMGHRERMINGAEYDALTRWHHVAAWCGKPGARRAVKRQFNKRVRRRAGQELACTQP